LLFDRFSLSRERLFGLGGLWLRRGGDRDGLDCADNIPQAAGNPVSRLNHQRCKPRDGLNLLTAERHQLAHLLRHAFHGRAEFLQLCGHGRQGLFHLA
jgi:hypothetical protein